MRRVLIILLVTLLVVGMISCEESDKVSKNLSKEADQFNVMRQITAINAITGDVMFQMTGRLSIEEKHEGKMLEVVVEYEKGLYAKHFLFLGDNGMASVEQLGYAEVNQYRYTLNYNPKLWIPVDFDNID